MQAANTARRPSANTPRSGGRGEIGRGPADRIDHREILYGPDYHAGRHERTSLAAREILGLVNELHRFTRVVDVGCGTGEWLAAARELGAIVVTGVEGPWFSRTALVEQSLNVVVRDLELPLGFTERSDLALCLEVAEHLTEQRAAGLVAELVDLAPAVLFGAAIPNQGGKGHVNERWQSYWATLFAKHDFVAVDIVRPRIWADDRIPYWYRQNIILYLSRADSWGTLSPRNAEAPVAALDLVHPVLMERIIEKMANVSRSLEEPTARQCLRAVAKLPGALGRAVERRLWRR
jgi:SAM-dependent methyltransferase